MENFVLEFAKPIIELKEKLSEIQEFGETNNIDMSKQIAELESQITSKSTEIFGSLTPWQRVQVARHPQRPKSWRRREVQCRFSRRWSNGLFLLSAMRFTPRAICSPTPVTPLATRYSVTMTQLDWVSCCQSKQYGV